MTTAVMLIGIVLMIVIHEGGHFVAAKSFDMKVTEAFFGFGPKLWSTQRGETEYGVKAIPLGGYVRIIGMNPLEEIQPDEEDRTYRAAPFWQKSIVVLAGVVSHLVVAFLLFLIVFAVWAGHPDPGAGIGRPDHGERRTLPGAHRRFRGRGRDHVL
jgi:RIP metalloprotease RseP